MPKTLLVSLAEIVRSVSVPDALRAVADDSSEPVVCMATHARTVLGRALFGSVAEDAVRGLEIPAVLGRARRARK